MYIETRRVTKYRYCFGSSPCPNKSPSTGTKVCITDIFLFNYIYTPNLLVLSPLNTLKQYNDFRQMTIPSNNFFFFFFFFFCFCYMKCSTWLKRVYTQLVYLETHYEWQCNRLSEHCFSAMQGHLFCLFNRIEFYKRAFTRFMN